MSKFLEVVDIYKTYQIGSKKLEVLKGVSFEVAEGELVAVTGQSGSGKTTLLHILGTLDSPDSGEIRYGGRALSGLRRHGLENFRNSEIGFIFQFFQLLPEFTAIENIIMPMLIGGIARKEASTRAENILAEVGLEERMQHFPNQLSGGEQQRAAIARALVQQPRLLLADEPTGNLDVQTGNRVFSLFRKLQKRLNLTSIIVTHNPRISEECDRILDLEKLNAAE
jgi:lipoprotein-releasing system ATP-binding protein